MAKKSPRVVAGGPDSEARSSVATPSPKSSDSPDFKNFDLAGYAAERERVALALIARRMEQARHGRRTVVESVTKGWNPQRDFLRNGVDPHASWRRRGR
jgi:hypothetical protein